MQPVLLLLLLWVLCVLRCSFQQLLTCTNSDMTSASGSSWPWRRLMRPARSPALQYSMTMLMYTSSMKQSWYLGTQGMTPTRYGRAQAQHMSTRVKTGMQINLIQRCSVFAAVESGLQMVPHCCSLCNATACCRLTLPPAVVLT